MTVERKLHWSAYLWPGLPHLWNRGSWAGLALAVGFSVLLNLLLATTFVWTRWLPAQTESIGAGVLATIWILAWIEGRADWRRYLAELSREGDIDPTEQSDQRFRLALKHYLAGDWVSTERELAKLLKLDARDAEACLLLATMWRRLERPRDACQMLDRLERLETAGPWQAEIHAERRLLAGLLRPDERPDESPVRTEQEETTQEPQPVPERADVSERPEADSAERDFPDSDSIDTDSTRPDSTDPETADPETRIADHRYPADFDRRVHPNRAA